MNSKVKITLVDDHGLLRQGLANLLEALGYCILGHCRDGKDLLHSLDQQNPPDVVLMDINMPEMDGYEATRWLTMNYPSIKVLALTMLDDDRSIIRMLKNGARGYLLKDANPLELKSAIEAVLKTGFHYSDRVTGKLIHSVEKMEEDGDGDPILLSLNAREQEFLKLAGTEMTYKEIADHMCLSPRTIDGYRDALFEKLNVKSRVGLVLFAIKSGLIPLR